MNFKIDLKNIDLKNISLEDIQAKLKNVDKKTWIKLGVSVGAVVFFLVIFYAVLNPIVNKKKAQLDDMNKKKEETAKFVSDIKSKNKKIKLKRPQYEQYSTLFHTKAEVEGLYQTLSEFAAMNNLVISKIEKKKIIDVSGAGDTVISLATILFYLDLPEKFIAEMCNLAGGITCMKSGVNAINLKELLENAERNNLDLYL